MPTTTGTEILDQLLDEVQGLGWKFTGTSTSAGSATTTTDPELNKFGSQALDNRIAGRFMYIPSASGADQVHSITTLTVSGSTTTITSLGTYGSTYTSAAHYILAIHPDVLRRLFNDALDRLRVRCYVPLFAGPTDGDMQASGVTNWTPSSGTPFAKQTTASEVFEGARSGVLTDAGSGGIYTQSALINIGAGKSGWMYAIAKAASSTGVASVLDASNTVLASVSFSQDDWLFIRKRFTGSSTSEQVRVRLACSTASGTVDLQFLGIVKSGAGRFVLPSYLNTRFVPVGVYYLNFPDSGPEADTEIAASLEMKRLRPGIDFEFQRSFAAANPFVATVASRWTEYPLLFVFDAPWSAPYGVAATFSTDSDTTACPPHLLVASCKLLLAKRYSAFASLEADAVSELASAAESLLPVDTVSEVSGWGGLF